MIQLPLPFEDPVSEEQSLEEAIQAQREFAYWCTLRNVVEYIYLFGGAKVYQDINLELKHDKEREQVLKAH